MNIDYSEVIKLRLSGLEDLDPVDVFLEDMEPSKGSVTIKCYGQAWTAYWGAMGGRGVAQFLNDCNEEYIAKNLSSIDRRVVDIDKIIEDRVSNLKKQYDSGEITSVELRVFTDVIESADEYAVREDHDLLTDLYGSEFWNELPMKENHEYTYLKKIITAVKQGINEAGLLEQNEVSPVHAMRI